MWKTNTSEHKPIVKQTWSITLTQRYRSNSFSLEECRIPRLTELGNGIVPPSEFVIKPEIKSYRESIRNENIFIFGSNKMERIYCMPTIFINAKIISVARYQCHLHLHAIECQDDNDKRNIELAYILFIIVHFCLLNVYFLRLISTMSLCITVCLKATIFAKYLL